MISVVALNIGELFVVLGLDHGPFSKGVGVAIELTNRLTDSLLEVGQHSIKAAMDFAETSNVIQQSFRGGAAAAEEWASSTASAMGRTTQQMREFASVNQSMLSAMIGSRDAAAEQSKVLSELAVDMGSFLNKADLQMMEAIRSGIVGITKPLETLGIVMTEANLNEYAHAHGIKLKMEQMDQASKELVRYNYLLDATKDMQGDAVRTADSLANQLKAMNSQVEENARSLGDQLLPQAKEFVAIARDMMTALTNGDGMAEILTGVGAALRTVADMALQAAEGWAYLAKAMASTKAGAAIFGAESAWDKRIAGIENLRDILAGNGANATGANGWIDLGNGMRGRMVNGKMVVEEKPKPRKPLRASDVRGRDDEEEGSAQVSAYVIEDNSIDQTRAPFQPFFGRDKSISQFSVFKPAIAAVASLGVVSEHTAKRIAEADKKRAEAHQHEMEENKRRGMAGGASILTSVASGNLAGLISGVASLVAPAAAVPIIGAAAQAAGIIADSLKKAAAMFVDTFAKPFLPQDQRFNKAMGAGGAMLAVSAPFVLPAMGMALATETHSFKTYQGGMTKGVDRVVAALEPFFRNLLPIAGLFIQLSSSVGMLLRTLIPGSGFFHAVFEGARKVAFGMAFAMVALFDLKVGIEGIIFGLLKWANDTFHVLGDARDTAEARYNEDVNKRNDMLDNAKAIKDMTAMSAAALAASDSLNALTQAANYNLPTWYRAGQTEFGASLMDPSLIPHRGERQPGQGLQPEGYGDTNRGLGGGGPGDDRTDRDITINVHVTQDANGSWKATHDVEQSRAFRLSGSQVPPSSGIRYGR